MGLQILVEREDCKDLYTAQECAMAATFVARHADDTPPTPGDLTLAGGSNEGVEDGSDGTALIADSTVGADTNVMAVDDKKGVAAQKATDQGQDIVVDAQGHLLSQGHNLNLRKRGGRVRCLGKRGGCTFGCTSGRGRGSGWTVC